jgi:hypothetical protein
MPAPPAPPPPPPESAIQGKLPTTVKPPMSQRESMRQASKGPSGLTIPLSTGAGGSAPPTTSMANLSIGGR